MKKKLFFLFLFSVGILNAQENIFQYKNTPLLEVIEDIELRYDVRFSFETSVVKSKKVNFQKSVSLKSFLNEISTIIDIDFIFLDDKNIVIKPINYSSQLNNLLDEVILVSEYLTSGFDQNKKDGSISLKPGRLGLLPGLTEPDVLQSLQLLPGISSPTESASNLNIRGGTPDQNLIVYDGIRVYHQGHLFGMISPFNPYTVESIHVFRSGTSARFGERISGVIDINSLNEIPDDVQGGFGVNFLHADGYLQVPLLNNHMGIMMSARSSINNLLALPTYNSFSNKVFQNTKIENINNLISEEELTILDDRFSFFDFTTKVILRPNESNKVSISSIYVDNSLNYANSDSDNDGSRDILDLENFGLSGVWISEFSEKVKATTQLRYSKYSSAYTLNEIQNSIESNELSKENSIEDVGFNIELSYKRDPHLTFYFGYDLANYDVSYQLVFRNNSVDNNSYNEKLTSHTLYSEFDYQKNNFAIRAGLRTSYFDSDQKTYMEPRLYSDYRVSKFLKLKGSAEVKNQALSQLVSFEFNELGLDDTLWVLADEDEIPVLNNKQITFGFEYAKNNWLLDVEYYSKKIRGLTSLTRGFSNSNSLEDYSTGSSDIFGIDILLKKKFKRYRTWLSYSYSKTDFTFSELQTSSFPGTFDQRNVLTWSHSYQWKKFQFSIGWQYATGIPFTNPTGVDDDELEFDSLNTDRLPNYHKLDMSAMHNFYFDKEKKLKARFGVSIINIYNRDNDIDKQFSFDNDVQGQIVERSTIGLGLTTNAVFRLYF